MSGNGRGPVVVDEPSTAVPRHRSAYLVGVLARAMTAQIDELDRAAAPLPDGWWFAEPSGRLERR